MNISFRDDITVDVTLADSVATPIATNLHQGAYRFLSVLSDDDHFNGIKQIGDDLRARHKKFIILGTGGSALGAMALKQAFTKGFVEDQVIFLDNPDPLTLDDLRSAITLKETAVIAVSKSGGTTETLSLLLAFQAMFEEQSLSLKDHFYVLTMPSPSALSSYADEKGLRRIDHDPEIGGRFSVFSNVGLLPAYLMGININAFRNGARQELAAFLKNPKDHAATLSAYRGFVFERDTSVVINVMMPYSDKLQLFARWFIQLYAESLGKDGRGLTPLPAIGTVDQHAQLQLFHDGPQDKWVTLLRVMDFASVGQRLSTQIIDARFHPLLGRKIGEILDVEAMATADSLRAAGLPIREIQLPDLSPGVLGQLMVFCVLEVILSAAFMGMNAFDQPGVEDSKVRIKALLNAGQAS